MHRSGTSALTRVVNLLGLRLGPEDDLYSEWDNPLGHWESASLVHVNESLLEAFGGTHLRPPSLPTGWERSRRAAALEPVAGSVFGSVYPPDGPWIWKDPRLCLTLPFWRRLIDDSVAVVFVWRHPEEVARSLAKRNGTPMEHGRALWERYNRRALTSAVGLPMVCVRFDGLMSDPDATVRRLAENLSSVDVQLTGDLGAATASIRPTERHHQADDATGLTDERAELLVTLRSFTGWTERFRPPQLPEESPTTDALISPPRWRGHASRVKNHMTSLFRSG